MPLRWRTELRLDLRARGCQAQLIGAGWHERSIASASGSGRGAAALAAALSALRLADVETLPAQARLRLSDEYVLHLLLVHAGPRARVMEAACARFEAALGASAGRRVMLVRAGRHHWLASAVEERDLTAWNEALQQAGVRAGPVAPALHDEWLRVGRHIHDEDAVLVLPRDEGATLLRLIDGEPVDLLWERFDGDDPGSLERRVRAFAATAQGRRRRPAWAQTDGLGVAAEPPEPAQVIYLLPESGALCRYVRDRDPGTPPPIPLRDQDGTDAT